MKGSHEVGKKDAGKFAEEVKEYRGLLEVRLVERLKDADRGGTIEEVRSLIFNAWTDDLQMYLARMLEWLNTNVDDVDSATVILISDTWNYFPHRELEGRCPVESFNQHLVA
jgi:hypothetical protein